MTPEELIERYGIIATTTGAGRALMITRNKVAAKADLATLRDRKAAILAVLDARAGIQRDEATERAYTLRVERETLAARLAGAREDARNRAHRAWERGDEAAGVAPVEAAPAVEEARAALAAFDAAHPEVAAARQAEREEAAQRATWN